MAIDLLGFGNTDNAVTTRPPRSISRGTADTWAKDCSSADANDGTAWPADIFNDLLAQLRVALRSAGITLDNEDDMLWRAMRSVGVQYGADSGAANTLTVAFPVPVASLSSGLLLLVKANADSTGASTMKADDTARKEVTWPDGSPIAAGDWKAGGVLLLAYVDTKYQLLCRLNRGGGGGGSPYQPGQLVLWPLEEAAPFTLIANGQAVSRTDHAALYAKIGTKYGPGNGTSTFNLPNYSGVFLRGWDNGAGVDPDRASRTNRGDGTTGDFVGTRQQDQYKSHGHSASGSFAGSGKLVSGSSQPRAPGDEANTSISGSLDDNNGVNVSVSASGGSETRPKNVTVNICIAY